MEQTPEIGTLLNSDHNLVSDWRFPNTTPSKKLPQRGKIKFSWFVPGRMAFILLRDHIRRQHGINGKEPFPLWLKDNFRHTDDKPGRSLTQPFLSTKEKAPGTALSNLNNKCPLFYQGNTENRSSPQAAAWINAEMEGTIWRGPACLRRERHRGMKLGWQ